MHTKCCTAQRAQQIPLIWQLFNWHVFLIMFFSWTYWIGSFTKRTRIKSCWKLIPFLNHSYSPGSFGATIWNQQHMLSFFQLKVVHVISACRTMLKIFINIEEILLIIQIIYLRRFVRSVCLDITTALSRLWIWGCISLLSGCTMLAGRHNIG